MKANPLSLPGWLAGLLVRIDAMQGGRALVRAGLLIGSTGVLAGLAGAVALWSGQLGSSQAAGPAPGMQLSLPDGDVVEVGATFRVQVLASPAPNVSNAPGCADVEPAGPDSFCDLKGYHAKIGFPPGLAWAPRVPPCETELPAAPPGVGACASHPLGGTIHTVLSPTLPVLVTDGSVLVEIDVQCLAPGDYTVTLPSLLNDPDGALYFDLAGGMIPVKADSSVMVSCSEVAGEVDPGGGTVDTGNGDLVEARLDIAPAALSGAMMITIDPEPASSAPAVEDTFNVPGETASVPDPANMPVLFPQVFDFGPDGLEFLNFASKLTFTYQDAAITQGNEEAIGVLHYDDARGNWEPMPIVERDADTNTIAVNVGTFSIYGIYEPVTQDTDSDGCRDIDEQLTGPGTQTGGGRRNALFFWDFFDTPTGAYPQVSKDRAVAAADVFSVLSRFGRTGDRTQNPVLTPVPPPPEYHPAFDRTGALVPPGYGPWNTRWPDGAIASVDIFAALASFGHACAMP